MPLSEAEISGDMVLEEDPSGDFSVTDEGSRLYVQHMSGDLVAFTKLEMLYGECAIRLATNMFGGDRHLAEDMVQEAWLKALKAESFDPTKSFRKYFLTIVANLCRDHFRRVRNKPVPVSLDVRPDDGEKFSDRIIDPSERISHADRTPELLEIADDVQGHAREVLFARLEGLSFAEISEKTGKAQATERWYFTEMRRNMGRIASQSGIHLRGLATDIFPVERARASEKKSTYVKTGKSLGRRPFSSPESDAVHVPREESPAVRETAYELQESYRSIFMEYIAGVPYVEMRKHFGLTDSQLTRSIITARKECQALLDRGYGI